MSIIITRGTDLYGGPYQEARFDPPQRHFKGAFKVRVYDATPGCPYRPDLDHPGDDGWLPYETGVLWDDEHELLRALLDAT